MNSSLVLQHQAVVDFDADLSHYGIKKGVLTNPAEGEIFAPVVMWLEAIDLVLDRLRGQGLDFERVQGLSGAGMQHGTAFWNHDAERILGNLDARQPLKDQLKHAFSHEYSPNWQDASTQKQCELFDSCLGDPETLAQVTGSKAHHRFSGPQIMRFRMKHQEHYEQTRRISLVSSTLSTVFLGKFAPIDIGDVCGMNLWDIKDGKWSEKLLELTAGGKDKVPDLVSKLGDVPEDGGGSFGTISPYFCARYGFPRSCSVIPCTGDNPATIMALPLRPSDAIVSLGTSTTYLMSTRLYKSDPSYHFMNHPTTAGQYMFMLCYKNGGLAREHIRDALSQDEGDHSWERFNEIATTTPPLGQESAGRPMKMGLFFPRPEIVPNVKAGTWRYLYEPDSDILEALDENLGGWDVPASDARAIIESQFLSLRLRSESLVTSQPGPDNVGEELPPQPRRVYLVGGGSQNPAIARICGEVLGSSEGVYRLDIGGNACALGAAYKAVWGCERAAGESFEDLIGKRWHEEGFVKKVADGYKRGLWERYGQALKGFEAMERAVLAVAGEGHH